VKLQVELNRFQIWRPEVGYLSMPNLHRKEAALGCQSCDDLTPVAPRHCIDVIVSERFEYLRVH